MKIRYFSDIHLEFLKPEKIDVYLEKIPLPEPYEIAVFAGDIGYPRSAQYRMLMEFMNLTFCKTFVIAGNHEYYHKFYKMEDTDSYMESMYKEFENISFLNNRYEWYKGFCFVGTTLWSKIIDRRYTINDTERIPSLTIDLYHKKHEQCVEFLKDAVQKGKCIVITHHLPSELLIDEKYKKEDTRRYNQWFYSDLDDVIEGNRERILLWIYGHTHTANRTVISGIPFVCNPIGYPGENEKISFSEKVEIKTEK